MVFFGKDGAFGCLWNLRSKTHSSCWLVVEHSCYTSLSKVLFQVLAGIACLEFVGRPKSLFRNAFLHVRRGNRCCLTSKGGSIPWAIYNFHHLLPLGRTTGCHQSYFDAGNDIFSLTEKTDIFCFLNAAINSRQPSTDLIFPSCWFLGVKITSACRLLQP